MPRGFEFEGRIREGVWKEGKFVDKLYMGLLSRTYREWRAIDVEIAAGLEEPESSKWV